MKKIFFAAIAGLFLAAGCADTPEVQAPVKPEPAEGVKKTVSFTATSGQMTRAYHERETGEGAGQYIKWEAGDRIFIGVTYFDEGGGLVGDEYNLEFTATSVSQDGLTATFEGEMTVPEVAETIECMACYLGAYDGQIMGYVGGSDASVEIPSVYEYREDGFTNHPMAAVYNGPIDGMSLDFRNIFTVIRIPVLAAAGSEGMKMETIHFSGNNGEMFGECELTVDENGEITASHDFGHKESLILDCGDGVALSGKATYFHIAVPVMDYQNGFSFTFVTDMGTTKKSAAFPATNKDGQDFVQAMHSIVTVPALTLAASIYAAIPDDAFRDYLLNEGYIEVNDQNGEITVTEDGKAEGLVIDVSFISDIYSLKGLNLFPNLTKLYCSETGITTLDVSENTALTVLDCSETGITTLDVSENTALTELYCSGTGITTLDVRENTALTDLDCSRTGIATLDVSENTALTYLNCSYTNIATLNVGNNPALTILNCSGTVISSLDVNNNPALRALDCSNTNITSLDVSGKTNLTHLVFGHPDIIMTSVDISGCTSLNTIYWIRWTNLISGGTLDAGGMAVKNFVARNMTDGAEITGFKCVDNTVIEEIDLSGSTGITTATVSGNGKLSKIVITGSGITDTSGITPNGIIEQ